MKKNVSIEERLNLILQQEESERAISLERLAQDYHDAGEPQKQFTAYDDAARLYQKMGDHLKAAMCFAAAATSWDIHTGWQSLLNSATRNYYAGVEAVKAQQFDYAESLFRNAAILYDKEGDYDRFSDCIIQAHTARRKKDWVIAFGKHHNNASFAELKFDIKTRIRCFFDAIASLVSEGFWGHGEKPFRTFALAILLIFGCAGIYAFTGEVMVKGVEKPLSLFEAVYFSVVTFSTVGYGDYAPVGITRIVAMFEVIIGIIILPLFLVALTRRFLRVER
ncbi:MAG: two pore domain potassium channel family protein [Candidatus Omnitrophica bacterium]|nr:two pore domain potassium channel family protein [Candidatus Omnitrophota bacterium]